MPAIVKNYIENKEVTGLKTIYESLLISFVNDSEKYARNQTMRNVIGHCLNTISAETGKRIKFQNFGNSEYRSREVGEAIRLLGKAMLIFLVYPATNTTVPSIIDYKRSPKLQFFDTGMINYFTKIQPEYFKYDDLCDIYRGLIAEHIIRQEITASDLTTNDPVPMWTRESRSSNAEVDIIIQVKRTDNTR